MFEVDLTDAGTLGAKIVVAGVGGAGGNAINEMIKNGVKDVEFIAVNTDVKDLERSLAPKKIPIGTKLTRGLGAGANPDIGKNAALEDKDKLKDLFRGADMVFVTCGLGGGTGTGAAPVIAQIAKEENALTVGVVTKPFSFEGMKKMSLANSGLENLKNHVDSIIAIQNQRLVDLAGKNATVLDMFSKSNEVLQNAVQGISDLINCNGHINVDFADVRTVMGDKGGLALMGVGTARGEGRAVNAVEQAIKSPLLNDISIEGAQGLLVNVTCGYDITMAEYHEIMDTISKQVDKNATIIPGIIYDESFQDVVKVTVVATGFESGRTKSQGPNFAHTKIPQTNVPTMIRTPTISQHIKAIDKQINAGLPDDIDRPTILRRNQR